MSAGLAAMTCAMTWVPTPPDGVSAVWYITALALAVLVIGVSKSGFGGGIAVLAVPLTANALPAQHAVGFLLPLLIAADLFAVGLHRGKQSWPHVRYVVTGALIGIGCSWLLLRTMQARVERVDPILALIVGVVCLLFVGLQLYRWTGRPAPSVPDSPTAGRVTGLAAGAVSTLTHGAGPIVTLYMMEVKLSKALFVGSMVVVFMCINLVKVPVFIDVGMITADRLVESAWFLPMVPVGSLLGRWMHDKIPEKPFTVIIYVATALAAVNLIFKAVS